MSDEHSLTLRQVDQARGDLYAIDSGIQVVMSQLARLPTRKDLARIALGIIFGTAGLVVGWLELFWRHCL
jgi:hypothetical protein